MHIYADEARQGTTRYVEATHYCAHVRKGEPSTGRSLAYSTGEREGMLADTLSYEDLRQCLIYDSHEQDAKLIGVEYMVSKEIYDSFDPEEQKLWHSHEYEVKSGMLILPKPAGYTDEEWEAAELRAMEEIIHLYGKTWHFWQVDAGHQYPFGHPMLMGSATGSEQIDLDAAMAKRNATFSVHHDHKAEARKDLQPHRVHPSKIDLFFDFKFLADIVNHVDANSWWQH